jgi:hypothetical protein
MSKTPNVSTIVNNLEISSSRLRSRSRSRSPHKGSPKGGKKLKENTKKLKLFVYFLLSF